MKPNRPLVAIAVAVSLASLATLAGCGGNDPERTAADSTSSSASASPESAGTQSPDAPVTDATDSATATAADTGGRLTKENFASKMRAAIEANHTAHIAMQIGSDLAAQGDVSYSGAGTSMRLTMDRTGMHTDLRFVGGKFYLSVPGMTPTGKFIVVTGDDKTMGPLASELQNFGPQGSIGIISKGLKQLTYVGTETIDGESLDRYNVTVDSAAVIEGLGGPTTGSQSKTVRYDLYVDKDNLLRRAVFNVLGQRMKLDVTDWGKPVHVSAPSAEDIVKMPTG